MSKRMWAVVAGACALALIAVVPGRAQNAKGWTPANQLIKGVHSSVSGPVRNMPKAKGKISPPREQPNPRRGRPSATQQATTLAPFDTVLQTAPSGALDTVSGLDLEGIDFTGYYPPDTNVAVGNNMTGDGQAVETVNTEFAVFDKATGQLEYGPVNISTLFASSGTACGQTGNGTDPIVLFDQISSRWIISVTADPPSNPRTNLMCLAVSTTSDATGNYYAYEINFGHDFPDYPKLSVWPDGYYYTADMFFGNSPQYLGAAACTFNRDDFDSNATTLRSQCFQGSTSDYRLLPANLDGSKAPPANAPGMFMELGSDNASLLLYKLFAPWTNGGSTSFTLAKSIPVAPFTMACGNGGTCIPQKGTTNTVDSMGDGLMYPLEYHNFGSYDSLVVSQSVNTGLAAGNVGIRWYEIQNVENGVSPQFNLSQQSTYTGNDQAPGNPAYYRWMGSIAEDQVGDLALGYSKSSGSIFPGISYTGQSATNGAPNEMADENNAFAGSGSETSATRWGDYSSMAVDPGDDCTFWYTNQYFPSNGISWNTRLLSFNFPDCPTFSLSSPSPSQTITAGGDAQYTIDVSAYDSFSQPVNFSPTAVYGLPSDSNSSAIFGSNSVTGTGSVMLTISNTTGLPSGTYPLYVVGTAGNAQKSVALTLVVGSGGGSGGSSFTVTATPQSRSISPGENPTYTVTVTSKNNFSGSVTLSASGLQKFMHGSFSVNPVSVSANGEATSTLTVRTNKNVAPSSATGYPLIITGTSSGVQPSTYTVYLVVQ